MSTYFADATIAIVRANTTLFTGIPVQIDTREAPEQTYGTGAVPYFTYDAMIQQASTYGIGPYSIKQGDKFSDVTNNRDYRVVSDPQLLPDNHVECIVIKTRGT